MPKDGEYHLLILGDVLGGEACGLVRHTWDVDEVRLATRSAPLYSSSGDTAVTILVALLKSVLARYDGDLNPQYVTVKRLLGQALARLEEAERRLWPNKGATPGQVFHDKAP